MPIPLAEVTQDSIITTSCVHDCAGRCLLRAHVRNGVIIRISTAEGPAGLPGLRACARGRAYRQRIYAPDRLQHPMKRTGQRGHGGFQRISWDEALDTIAGRLLDTRRRYGNGAVFSLEGAGNFGQLHATSNGALSRFMNMSGGCTTRRGQMSYGGAIVASQYTFGCEEAGNDSADLVNSKFVLLWAWNPAETVSQTPSRYNLMRAKEAGIPIVVVDPRYTDTVATYASEWVPIRPGTDGAMLAAMAYIIISEGLQDQHFIDTYVGGYPAFRDYILGDQDGTPKTPSWAEPICGVPAGRIASLASRYASAQPAALVPGWGHQRTAYGEQPVRMTIALACLTGNVGKSGGNAAGHYVTKSYATKPIGKLPVGDNPTGKSIPINKWADAIMEGTAGGYESDIHMAYIVGRNIVNQIPNTRKSLQALDKLDFVVVHEQFMTPTAKYADILLPVTTWFEREDIVTSREYAIYMPKIIEPMYECKSDLQILTELANRMGIYGYNNHTDEEWLRSFTIGSDIEDFDKFKEEGVFYFQKDRPYIAFREQIEDPARYPFATPSGKIELYSPRLEAFEQPDTVPGIPKYVQTWESMADPIALDFPLQLITPHCKTFTHSTMTNIPWLQILEPHGVWMNPADATARGISNGETVRVYNNRGETRLPAKVTGRIMPGVVSIYEGIWYQPDEHGIDRGGCANLLTRDEDTPVAEGATTHTSLVEVSKI